MAPPPKRQLIIVSACIQPLTKSFYGRAERSEEMEEDLKTVKVIPGNRASPFPQELDTALSCTQSKLIAYFK